MTAVDIPTTFKPMPQDEADFAATRESCALMAQHMLNRLDGAIERTHIMRESKSADMENRVQYSRTLASLLEHEADVLEFMAHPSKLPTLGKKRDLPEDLRDDAENLEHVARLLYGQTTVRQMAVLWLRYALQEGGEGVHLSTVRDEFDKQVRDFRNDPRVQGIVGFSSLSNAMKTNWMPDRTTVKVGGVSRQGYANMTFDPERGRAAVLAMVNVKSPCHEIAQEDRIDLTEQYWLEQQQARAQGD